MSDTETEIPRLPIEDGDAPRLIEVVRDLYADVLRTYHANTNSSPEEVLKLVVTRWMTSKQGPFMLILSYWSATTFTAPNIWEEPTAWYDGEDFTRPSFVKKWRLKPPETIDLRLNDFGGGDDFFSCFELRDAISEAQYDDLLDKFDARDKQLAAQAS